jgi:alkyl sulfatase BDS1-like metallo-beta-lactamase superfamily hydrolase
VAEGIQPPTSFTAEANRAAVSQYATNDRSDVGDADRGFIANFEGGQLRRDDGELYYDAHLLDYIPDDAPAPESVNPSLWRQSQVTKREGVYQVVDRLYQVRRDANLTIVDAPTVWSSSTPPPLSTSPRRAWRCSAPRPVTTSRWPR